jgi:hypothetical protein
MSPRMPHEPNTRMSAGIQTVVLLVRARSILHFDGLAVVFMKGGAPWSLFEVKHILFLRMVQLC